MSIHGVSNFNRFEGNGKTSSLDKAERFNSFGIIGFDGLISTGEYSISYEGSVGAWFDRKITADEGSLNVAIEIGDIEGDDTTEDIM